LTTAGAALCATANWLSCTAESPALRGGDGGRKVESGPLFTCYEGLLTSTTRRRVKPGLQAVNCEAAREEGSFPVEELRPS